MLLKELADTSFDYKFSNENNGAEHVYKFFVPTINGKFLEYEVFIYLGGNNYVERKDMIEVLFQVSRADSTKTDEITGTGNAFKIFSTVLKIIKKEIKDDPNIKIINFGAKSKEKSRIKLYNHFVDNLEKYLPGWKLKKVSGKSVFFHYQLEKQ